MISSQFQKDKNKKKTNVEDSMWESLFTQRCDDYVDNLFMTFPPPKDEGQFREDEETISRGGMVKGKGGKFVNLLSEIAVRICFKREQKGKKVKRKGI